MAGVAVVRERDRIGDSTGVGTLGVGCLLRLGRTGGAALRARCSESDENDLVLTMGL